MTPKIWNFDVILHFLPLLTNWPILVRMVLCDAIIPSKIILHVQWNANQFIGNHHFALFETEYRVTLNGMAFAHFINFLRTMYHIKMRLLTLKLLLSGMTHLMPDAFDLNLSSSCGQYANGTTLSTLIAGCFRTRVSFVSICGFRWKDFSMCGHRIGRKRKTVAPKNPVNSWKGWQGCDNPLENIINSAWNNSIDWSWNWNFVFQLDEVIHKKGESFQQQ